LIYNSWKKDLSDSVKALKTIEKTVLPRVISGKIHSIETSHNFVLMLMDQKSGIDYIREDNVGLQGIAARVQWGKAWNTFTIRAARHTGAKTELEKRLSGIANGYFYPAFTMQAYFNNRKDNLFLSLGIIKTKALFDFLKNYPDKIERNKSDNSFVFVRWYHLSNLVKTVMCNG